MYYGLLGWEIPKNFIYSLHQTRELKQNVVSLDKKSSKIILPLMKKYQIKGNMICLISLLPGQRAKTGLSGCVWSICTVNLFATPKKTKSAFPDKTWYWGQPRCIAAQVHLQSSLSLEAQHPG